VIKATMPLFVCTLSYVMANKRYPTAIVVCILLLVVGSVVSNLSGFTSSGTSTSTAGVIVCLVSLAAASTKPVVAMIVMAGTEERPKLAPTLLLFYDTFIAFWFMLIYWLASPERQGSIDYLGDHNKTGIGILIIVIGSTVAFAFNLGLYYYVMLTSALASAILSNAIKIVLIIVSAIMSGVTDPVSWTGISIVVLAILAYAYISFKGASPPPPKKEDPEKGTMKEPLNAK